MIVIDKWGGLATNASPYAVPPGAAVEQVNLQCIRPGQIEGRPGLEAIDLGTSGTALDSLLVSVHRIHGTPERVLAKDALGRLFLLVMQKSQPSVPLGVTLATAPSSPSDISLSTPLSPPFGVTLTTAPLPPSGVTLSSVSSPPSSPSGVTLTTAPSPPAAIGLSAVPQPPSSVGLLAAPTGLAVTT